MRKPKRRTIKIRLPKTPLPSLGRARAVPIDAPNPYIEELFAASQPSVLEEAANIVQNDRRKNYGEPAVNHKRTAELWSAYLGFEIAPRQVCMMNILQKISRDRHRETHDNLVDIAGYAENAHLCRPANREAT